MSSCFVCCPSPGPANHMIAKHFPFLAVTLIDVKAVYQRWPDNRISSWQQVLITVSGIKLCSPAHPAAQGNVIKKQQGR